MPRKSHPPHRQAQSPAPALLHRPYVPAAVFLGVHAALAALFVLNRAPSTDAAWTGFPLDDAWIHLVYARSAAQGELFAYNPGQLETGFTSPLWVLLLSPGVPLAKVTGLSIALWVKGLGVACAWLTSWMAFRLVQALGGPPRAAWLAGLAVAVDPSLSFAQVSGMEVLLASATALGAVLALVRGRAGAAGVALALALLSRPENAGLAFAGWGLILWSLLKDKQRGALKWALLLPLPVAALGWAAYCLAVSGRPLPSTFYAKAHLDGGLLSHSLSTLADMLLRVGWFTWGSGLVLLLWGALTLLGSARKKREPLWPRLLLVVHPWVFLFGIATSRLLAQDWPFYWNRYIQPALPFLLVLWALGVDRALQLARNRAPAWARAGAVALLVLTFIKVPGKIWEEAERFAWNCQNINEVQVALGHWLRQNTLPGEWVATNDAGAIRYFSERPVLDLIGLNDFRLLRDGPQALLSARQPRFLAVFPSWFPRLGIGPGLQVVHSARSDRYTICDCDQEEMVVLEASRPRP